MRVAVIVVAMLAVNTPSQASQSCMSKTEARNHFSSSHIYWHGPDHCWDATPSRHHQIRDVRRHEPTREVERKGDRDGLDPSKPDLKPDVTPDSFRWRDSMSEMLPETEQMPRAPPDARHDVADAAAAGPAGSDSTVNVASFPLASSTLASRWVDIVQVVPLIAERKPEPSVTPRGLLPLFAVFVLAGGFIVLLLGMTLHQWPRSTTNV